MFEMIVKLTGILCLMKIGICGVHIHYKDDG